MTSDYDFWLHVDDIDLFNHALKPFDMVPNRTATEARQLDRYVLENDEHVDVLIARAVSTIDGARVAFDDLWPRRAYVDISADVRVAIPALDDLIATKKFGARPRDADDIRWLEELKRSLS